MNAATSDVHPVGEYWSMAWLKELAKRALGPKAIAAVRARLLPLRLEALHRSIERHGWSLETLAMTDDEAAVHFANDVDVDIFSRTAIRLFHQYKIALLSKHLTPEYIARSSFIEIGDSDGLVLRALGKSGFSINNDPRCIELIHRNGIESCLGLAESLEVPDKSYDVAMTFQTLEHGLNPVAFLQELTRVARDKVILSVPGVTRTMIHPRVKGMRVGEEHVFELCTRDLLRLATHLPLRLALHDRMPMFAPPRSVLGRLHYVCSRNPELFAGCFRWFDFYVFDVDHSDHGVSVAETTAIYRERR